MASTRSSAWSALLQVRGEPGGGIRTGWRPTETSSPREPDCVHQDVDAVGVRGSRALVQRRSPVHPPPLGADLGQLGVPRRVDVFGPVGGHGDGEGVHEEGAHSCTELTPRHSNEVGRLPAHPPGLPDDLHQQVIELDARHGLSGHRWHTLQLHHDRADVVVGDLVCDDEVAEDRAHLLRNDVGPAGLVVGVAVLSRLSFRLGTGPPARFLRRSLALPLHPPPLAVPPHRHPPRSSCPARLAGVRGGCEHEVAPRRSRVPAREAVG